MSGKEKFQEYVRAYYEGDIQKGRQLLEEFSTDKQLEQFYNTVIWNGQFYISKCPSQLLRTIKPTFFFTKKEKEQGIKKFAINPFIVQDKKTKQYIVGTRVLNYAGNDGVEPMVCQGKIISQYEIYIFDPTFTTLNNLFPLTVNFVKDGRLVDRDWPYATGTEDYRVIPTENEDVLLGSCTGIETHPQGPVRMCKFFLRIKREGEKITGLVAENLIPLQGYEDDKQQKNWLFFYTPNMEQRILYSITPSILLSEKDGYCQKIIEQHNKFYHYRNGSPPIPFSFDLDFKSTGGRKVEGYLTLAHTSADYKHRVYYHRFFFFTHNFHLLYHSSIFYFEKAHTIEFVSGMVFNGQRFIITLGFRDRFAHIHELRLENFYSLFQDLNS